MLFLVVGTPIGMGRMCQFGKVEAETKKDAESLFPDKSIWYRYRASEFSQSHYEKLKNQLNFEHIIK